MYCYKTLVCPLVHYVVLCDSVWCCPVLYSVFLDFILFHILEFLYSTLVQLTVVEIVLYKERKKERRRYFYIKVSQGDGFWIFTIRSELK